MRRLVCIGNSAATFIGRDISVHGGAYKIIEGLAGSTPHHLQDEYVSQGVAESIIEQFPDDWKIICDAGLDELERIFALPSERV